MFFFVSTAVIVLLGLGILGAAGKVLFRKGWLLGWLRGSSGVLLCLGAGACALTALDLYSYKQVMQDKPIGSVTFEKLGEQKFKAVFTALDGEPLAATEYILAGDQWQLDARILRWKGVVRRMGAKPGYRLDRISGRYISLDDERTKPRTVYGLHLDASYFDLWAWFNKQEEPLAWVEAVYGNATFIPMANGAAFQIAITDSGLVATPANEAAQKAVNLWY